MLIWKQPVLEDVVKMRHLADLSGMAGCDSSAVNIFLLREKYNTKIAFSSDALFRSYSGSILPGRNGFAFPAGEDPEGALKLLVADCKERNIPVSFVFLTEEQKDLVSECCPEMVFETSEENSDYIYTAQHLAELKGKKNEKKRNRVNHFDRVYTDWEIRYFDNADSGDFLKDMIEVEDKWFEMQAETSPSSVIEKSEIYEACQNWDKLGLIGAVLYVAGIPAAMTISSEISRGCYDIHFEKCYGDYSRAGGFAVINKYFAKHLWEKYDAKLINREEDIGISGLRNVKMAYRPDEMLVKYHTR